MNELDNIEFDSFDPSDVAMPERQPNEAGHTNEDRIVRMHDSVFDKIARQVPGFASVSSNLETGGNPSRVEIERDELGGRTLKVLSSQGFLFEIRNTPLEQLEVKLVGAPEMDPVVDAFCRINFAIPIETDDLYELLVRLNQWSNAWITIFGRFEPPRTSLQTNDR